MSERKRHPNDMERWEQLLASQPPLRYRCDGAGEVEREATVGRSSAAFTMLWRSLTDGVSVSYEGRRVRAYRAERVGRKVRFGYRMEPEVLALKAKAGPEVADIAEAVGVLPEGRESGA